MRYLVGGLLFMAGLGVVGAAAWWANYAFTASNSAVGDAVILVTKGQTAQDVTQSLTQKQMITNPQRFLWLGKLSRQWKRLRTGEYQVSGKMSPMQILAVLTSGVSVQYPLTIREGENIYEIAKDIQSQGLGDAAKFIQLCKDKNLIQALGLTQPAPTSLEGYLFPDTYFLNHTQTMADMIRLMYRRFSSEWGTQEDARARELGMTRHQVITLASVIEKETGAPEERPMIGSVFHNRLKKRMKLQSDPTIIYGIWERYDGNIHRSDISSQTPYNTYFVPALPIGPISNPGKASIQAALFPAQSEYLFFVSQNDGKHRFTRTYGEHVAAVRKFQLDPKAREGKSWRNLNP